MNIKIEYSSLLKLFIYSMFYGFFLINWVDLLGVNSDPFHVYHLWLIAMYFAPAFVVFLIYGEKDWSIFIALGLFVSLMNDILFPIADQVMFGTHSCCGSFLDFYKFNLGFDGFQSLWTFQGGLLQLPVPSILMGISIYLRIIIIPILLYIFINNMSLKSFINKLKR